MDMEIRDPRNGTGAFVTTHNQLEVFAESVSQQHYVSKHQGNTFQLSGNSGTLTSGDTTILHVRNDSPELLLVVTFMRAQVTAATGGTFDSLDNYLEFGFNRTVSSGGTAATPVNMNRSSGVVAAVTATEGNPTVAGTFQSVGDRVFPTVSGEAYLYNKEGSVILSENDTMEFRYVGTHTAGEINVSVTFMMVSPDD